MTDIVIRLKRMIPIGRTMCVFERYTAEMTAREAAREIERLRERVRMLELSRLEPKRKEKIA
ncbi:hypothetical protein [Salipiger sp. PrR003]|uniref:hypothetical protein n=1 Tax=Salipiger sp. PrR003 TaxID=2706776 RepID=UPI0013DC77C1|nr:hypothetical protein [Salipiger sp. PrR003]NDV50364.1 hypothetical protein [Salipiger sp. PrR003]